jgi:hypothetical protein
MASAFLCDKADVDRELRRKLNFQSALGEFEIARLIGNKIDSCHKPYYHFWENGNI